MFLLSLLGNKKFYNMFFYALLERRPSGRVALWSVLFFVICSTSLSCNNELSHRLSEINTIIESNSQKALLELQGMDTDSFWSLRQKAEYALLMSMALDKNYIDKTDFEVLQPAIDYYSKRGTGTERMRMLYYQGRIFRNAGDNESAMKCFAQALDFKDSSSDKYTLARIYGVQANIYSSLFNYDLSVESAEESAKIFKELKDSNNYFNTINKVISGSIIVDDPVTAFHYLSECDSLWMKMNEANQRTFFNNWLNYNEKYASNEDIVNKADEYLLSLSPHQVSWSALANAYYVAGELDMAENALEWYDRYEKRRTAGIEGVKAHVSEARGKYRDALEHYKQYIHLSDSADLVAYRHNTRAVPEMHELDS